MKIIVVGCGRLGAEVASRLSCDGLDVTVVDRNVQAFGRLDPAFQGRTIEGVGVDRDVLICAGVERADALAALTSSDSTNIIAARIARNVFGVPRVVARLYEPRRAEIYQRLGLPAVSATSWGVGRVIQLLAHGDLNVTMTLGNGEAELIEAETPPHWVRHTVGDLSVPGEIGVVAIFREGKVLISTPDTEFREGDRLTIALLTTSRGRLERLLALR